MSRIGRTPIAIPGGVKVAQQGTKLAVEGPKGKLALTVPAELSATIKDGVVTFARSTDLKSVKALHGLYRALAANMVKGVAEGFVKELEVVGVGYRAQVQGKNLSLSVGFSHPVVLPIPEGITIDAPKPTIIIVKGADKQLVGQVAANIRRVAPPEPYKGKGIKYAGEQIRRKAGKAATGAKGGGGAK
jgi:large subunit ribosomal protein L6